MALATATVTMNLADKLGTKLVPGETRIAVTTNVDTVVDTVGNTIRLGSGTTTLNPDGTAALTVWIPGTGSNPASWQTTITVDYRDKTSRSGRSKRSFGPFTITADADLADLVAEQEVPPTYLSTVTGALTGYVADAQAAATAAAASAAQAVEIAGGDITASIAAAANGANVSRFISRAQSGENLTITVLGDSMWAGQTVTDPATDGAAILLANDLSARFPGTVTVQNRAFGGRTMLTLHTFSNVEDALADKADLYIIGGGRNDAANEFTGAGGIYKEGYPRAGSIASRERVIRMIRDRVPKADIMLTSESPYRASTGTSTNAVISSYYADVERLAAQYGCEWVDVYAAVLARPGGYDDLMHADGVHPNTAGHRFMANVVLAKLPAAYNGPVISPAAPGPLAIRKPGEVDTTKARLGYVAVGATIQPGLSFTKSGAGWSGTAPHLTTTAGNYIEYAFTGTELHVNLSNTNGASPIVFDVSVDGATVATNVAPAVQGIAYYYPIAMGLSVAAHTVRLTLVSGTMSINQAAALVGPGSDQIGSTVTVDLTGTVSVQTLSTGGTASTFISDVSVPLPSGWAAMDVDVLVTASPRVSGETTTIREFQFTVRNSTATTPGAILRSDKRSVLPVAASTIYRDTVHLSWTDTGKTVLQKYRVEAYATGTDKSSQFIDSWIARAICRRTA